MKKKDIYEVALKILGLLLVLPIIKKLEQIISFFFMWMEQFSNPALRGISNQTPLLLLSIFFFACLVAFSGILIFKTEIIAKLISKPSDQFEGLQLPANKKSIFEVSLVLLGLITIVWTVPDFLMQFKLYLSNIENYRSTTNQETFLTSSFLKITIGIASIIFSDKFSTFLVQKLSKNE